MSTCISRHGEFSEHETGRDSADRFTCQRCHVFDEDAALQRIAELEAAQASDTTGKTPRRIAADINLGWDRFIRVVGEVGHPRVNVDVHTPEGVVLTAVLGRAEAGQLLDTFAALAGRTVVEPAGDIDWPTVESAVRRGVSEYSRAHLIPANDLAGAVPEAMRKLAENWGSLIAPYVTACIREDLRKARLAAESGQDGESRDG